MAEAGDVIFGNAEIVLHGGGIVFVAHDGGEQFRGDGAAFLEVGVGVATGIRNVSLQAQAGH